MFLGGLMVSVFSLQSEVLGLDPRPVQFKFFLFFFCVPRKQILLRFAWTDA